MKELFNTEHCTKNIFVNSKRRFELTAKLEELLAYEKNQVQVVISNWHSNSNGLWSIKYFIREDEKRHSIRIDIDNSKYYSVKTWIKIVAKELQKEYSSHLI